jgi:Domain of unknown function (DUF4383)
VTLDPHPAPAGRRWTPAQLFALVFGVVYLAAAVGGFVVNGGVHDFAGMHHGEKLLIFAVNPLHDVIHLVLALGWLVAVPWHRTARLANLVIGVTLGLVTVLGFVGGMGMLGMVGIADPDNFLHLATATLALYFGAVAAERSDDADLAPPERTAAPL